MFPRRGLQLSPKIRTVPRDRNKARSKKHRGDNHREFSKSLTKPELNTKSLEPQNSAPLPPAHYTACLCGSLNGTGRGDAHLDLHIHRGLPRSLLLRCYRCSRTLMGGSTRVVPIPPPLLPSLCPSHAPLSLPMHLSPWSRGPARRDGPRGPARAQLAQTLDGYTRRTELEGSRLRSERSY